MICPSDHARSELMLRIGVCGRPVCEVVLQVGHGRGPKTKAEDDRTACIACAQVRVHTRAHARVKVGRSSPSSIGAGLLRPTCRTALIVGRTQ